MFQPFRLRIPESLLEAMLQQASTELPNECCGLLAGKISGDGRTADATHRYPLVNAMKSTIEFESDPKGMFLAMKDMRREGTEVLAVYHTHPTSAPIPSRKDIERNFGISVMSIIIGMLESPPEVRAWWLNESGYQVAEWEIVRNLSFGG